MKAFRYTSFFTLKFSLLLLFSCNQQQEQTRPDIFAPKVVEAKGYIVPKDSMATPKSVPAGKPKIVTANKPTVIPVRSNIHLAGIPKTVLAGTPKICTPGKDSFSLPKVIPAIKRPFVAGIPEMVIAAEAVSKEQNPQNFISFTKHEGLKANDILCMLQDKNGNIWFGTWDGGVSRYDGKYFTPFTQKEGLNSNNVWSIYEDRAGNLWFGTVFGGVSKYDGKSFTNYTDKEGLGNDVGSILEDKSGNIWFGTMGSGVVRLDRDGKSFTHYTEKEGLIRNGVKSILEDRLGNIWFGTDGGVSRLDRNGKSFTNYTDKQGLSDNYIWCIYEDRSGNLWFGTNRGVSRLDRDSKTFTYYTEKEGLGNNSVGSILEDRLGNIWFGTYGGVSRLDRETKYFTHFTKEDGLADNNVNCMLEDRSGGLWFGTDRGGVSKYNGRTFTNFTRKEGLNNNEVTSIFEDKSGNLWFGINHGGVSKYDGKYFTPFTQKEGLDSNNVVSIYEDRAGNLWFGCYWGGVFKYDGKSFTHFTVKEGLCADDVTKILQDKTGNLWVGTGGAHAGVSRLDRDGKNFTNYTDKEGLSNNDVWSIFEDKSGNLWFGTNRGVSRLDRDGKSFTHFTVKEGLSGNKVSCIIEDKLGNLWFGTDGGVSLLDRDGKTFTHFTEKEGLSNNDVSSIFEDRTGNIWVGTSRGLNKLNPKSLSKLSTNNSTETALFKSYTYEDGFLGIECNENAIYEEKNGTIWIGTTDRLTAYHPEGDQPDTIPPNIQLTGIALFNEKIPWVNLEQKKDTNIVLSNGVSVGNFQFDSLSKWYNIPQRLSLRYNNNYVTFNFVGITTKSPQKVRYQYKLEGLDNNWSALASRTEASYGNLSRGNYTFRVRAANGDGYWSKELNYTFMISPPWWQTWWAYALYGIIVIAVVWVIVHYRLRNLRRELEQRKKEQQIAEMKQKTAELEHQASELEMQALRAQMNPHFIFNSLNSINRFILKKQGNEASEYLTKFSKLIRMILNSSANASVSLAEDLEALGLYLELESLRFEKRFNYKIECDPDLDADIIQVPPMLLQPFVENAIWHGLMNKESEGHLWINIDQEDSTLICTITDNGIGRKRAGELKSKSAAHKSMGMKITESRIAMMQKMNAENNPVQIRDLVDADGTAAGTEVLLRVPVA